jgi:hypothetical protein
MIAKLINTTKAWFVGLIQWQMRSLTNLDALLTKPNFSLILFQVTAVILLYSNFSAP